MRKFYIICTYFIILYSYSQTPKVYTYYIEMSSNDAPVFKKTNNKLVYQGKDLKQKQVFSKYNVVSYEQAFPDAIDANLLNIYVLKTTNVSMVRDLLKTCKENYKSSEDITDRKIDLLYVPNDYGNTSPVPNLGANVSRKDLDYLHVSDAWEITKGNPNIKIGISDTQIKYDLLDFSGKVTVTSQNPPYLSNNVGNSHGTTVAAFAAAKGDNAHGSVGVCMDCSIVEGSMGYSGLYKMAQAGARVINMSWTYSGYTNSPAPYSSIEQAVVNDLVNNYHITLVAAAGNKTSFSTPQSFHSNNVIGNPETPLGILYVFPASYDNVISVSTINHKYPINLPLDNSQQSYCCTSPWYPIHLDIEDSVSRNINVSNSMNPIGVFKNGYYQNAYDPSGLVWMHTLNDKVDILATGYEVFNYSNYMDNVSNPIGSGTSYAAPMVSGTIGLMLSIDECLVSKEIESILQLTTKDIESMDLNTNFKGYVGAGKLEIGNAVKFVNEMAKPNGISVIENHIFNRFNFLLHRINNQLTIKNVVFKENSSASFIARNSIEVLNNSDFIPNSSGSIDLKLDSAMNISCSTVNFERKSQKSKIANSENKSPKIVLHPNPNKGVFTINLGIDKTSLITCNIYDISGKLVYNSSSQTSFFHVNLPNITSGVYFVKLQGNNYNETVKFIKE